MTPRSLFHISISVLFVALTAFFLSCSSSSTDVAVDDEDTILPSNVVDLSVAAFTDTSVTLTWTAPGDDSTSGTAAQYDIRYSTVDDLWNNWDGAFQAQDEPRPHAAGETETMTISGLMADSTYYFAILTSDEVGNWSWMSNVCRVTCFADFVVNFADPNLAAAVRNAISKPSGDIMKSDLLGLIELPAEDAGITDLSGVEYCIRLQRFFAINNSISDLTPLGALPDLVTLDLTSNAISDIAPLVSNPGIGPVDQVHLEDNPLSFDAIIDDIPALISRGVNVTWTRDTTPPAGIDDLHMTGFDATSAAFSWTAPGDDGTTGLAYLYELRYAADSLGFAGWTGATLAAGAPTPGPAGTIETMEVTGLETDSTYYFALRTRDESNNWSVMSNIVKVIPFVDSPVTFPDPNLESAIRTQLGMPTGDIYDSDLLGMTELDATAYGITGLTGIEHCTNLENLVLRQNQISDISLLSALVNLMTLDLDDNLITDISAVAPLTRLQRLSIRENQISDISPVASLTLLQYLFFTENTVSNIGALSAIGGLIYLEAIGNSITDLTPLAGHASLMFIFLTANNISDIGPLAGLAAVTYLYLDVNDIVDVSAVSGLSNIQRLSLRYNSIADIAPLVANTGLAAGDEVWLESNPLSATSVDVHIPALETRGVTVHYQ